jgi:peptidoglycan/xylan/chitin deacetylase (PgdA/CDA1 family)
MIAVVANPSDRDVISEFFELFKTPWEFYREGKRYDVVLCAGNCQFDRDLAGLVLIYSGHVLAGDSEQDVRTAPGSKYGRVLSCSAWRIPIYHDCVTFPQDASQLLVDEETRQTAVRVDRARGNIEVRIGYDLFSEVRTLLGEGQPLDHAGIPTIELHISLLRELIVGSGIPLVEIPPSPDGYCFIACLTHDVDHPSIRLHRFDHTMFGFLYRAIFGSLLDAIRRRISFSCLLSNWAAALKLPLVHLGLTPDFWHRFQDYPKIEKGLPSSFFVIPFKGRPGVSGSVAAPSRRAARYGAEDICAQIRTLMAAGCEIGLHGIDAWHDSSRGREELEEIRRITGAQELGVRMHWLYFSQQSPLYLERAGATYDSTVGYNEAIGYRAGTTQAFRPLAATRLLELPLHIMDTALFYPQRLNLSSEDASKQVENMIGQFGQLGGSLTINWHDRSIAPERQWGAFYEGLVNELESKGAWFATAAQAVAWYRKRRSAVFESTRWEAGAVHVKITLPNCDQVPGLQLRVHYPGGPQQATSINAEAACVPGGVRIALSPNSPWDVLTKCAN